MHLKATALSLIFLCAGTFPALASKQQETPMQKVEDYAHGRKVVVTQDHGNYWIEIDGVDAFGTGKTVDIAAENFLIEADLIDHELNPPVLHRMPDSSKDENK